MRVEAVVPAWMLADGEYVGLATGDPVRTGFALAVTATGPGGTEALEQSGARPGLTTVGGRTEVVGHTTVLRSPPCCLVLLAAGRLPLDVGLHVEGWLTVEPFLWVPDGELARARPEGCVGWTVARVRVVGGSTEDLARLPDEAGVDPDAAYVLDLTR
ncbi:hypothetical protein [Actinomycetospora soli]|uniref:hypothetical protein n=1 Tax=Actinomycetospora soli TaxID=2893887 RepID=UPI001E4623FA|nr:hypothetical protein [Actinomycetospora soli]MCD2185720.1 hypothetical protein [Actinomycetospora soli]